MRNCRLKSWRQTFQNRNQRGKPINCEEEAYNWQEEWLWHVKLWNEKLGELTKNDKLGTIAKQY